MTDPMSADDTATLTPTAGQLLRQAREGAGLHVVALAATLKVPVRKLEALEAGRFDELPDKTFVRTLALSVCRQLKVDPTPILALLPQSEQVRLGETPSLNTPFRTPDSAPVPKVTQVSAVPRPVLFAVGVLLLAAVVWFTVPARDPATAVVTTPALDSAAVSVTETPTPAGVPLALAPSLAPAAAGDAPAVTTAPAEAGEGAAAEPVVAATAAATAQVAPAAPVAPVAPATDGTLSIRASEVSWVEVVGASGNLLLQRELAAGEAVGFSTDGPYKVVVGRVDATQVRVRGKALDISGYARNNVARFEVK